MGSNRLDYMPVRTVWKSIEEGHWTSFRLLCHAKISCASFFMRHLLYLHFQCALFICTLNVRTEEVHILRRSGDDDFRMLRSLKFVVFYLLCANYSFAMGLIHRRR